MTCNICPDCWLGKNLSILVEVQLSVFLITERQLGYKEYTANVSGTMRLSGIVWHPQWVVSDLSAVYWKNWSRWMLSACRFWLWGAFGVSWRWEVCFDRGPQALGKGAVGGTVEEALRVTWSNGQVFLETLEQCENQLWLVRLIGDEFHGWGRLLPCDLGNRREVPFCCHIWIHCMDSVSKRQRKGVTSPKGEYGGKWVRAEN